MALTDLRKRLGKWVDLDQVRATVEGWREDLLSRVDSRMLDRAADFVDRQKGRWEHQDWEGFLEDLKREGYEVSGEMRDNVGLILERLKGAYSEGALKKFITESADPDKAREMISDTAGKLRQAAEKTRQKAETAAREGAAKAEKAAQKAKTTTAKAAGEAKKKAAPKSGGAAKTKKGGNSTKKKTAPKTAKAPAKKKN